MIESSDGEVVNEFEREKRTQKFQFSNVHWVRVIEGPPDMSSTYLAAGFHGGKQQDNSHAKNKTHLNFGRLDKTLCQPIGNCAHACYCNHFPAAKANESVLGDLKEHMCSVPEHQLLTQRE
uniref:Uncharacterized protein n=1 Tax=Trichuris muris TaxID=70415 RepID=A0A5S6QYA4_TRIMR